MVTGLGGVIGISLSESNATNKSIEAIKAGLEECPNLDSVVSMDIILVKSCKEYTEEFYKFNEDNQ